MGVATSAEFVVPEGYVAVLRGFRYQADPVLDLPCTDVLISILVDDIPQPNYDQMALGSERDEFIPTYILADNGQRIALRYDNSAAAPANSVEVCMTLYGNLLLRTGVPIEYQPGNPAVSSPIVRGTPLRPGGGVERAPKMQRIRGARGRGVGRAAPSRPVRRTQTRFMTRPERRRAAIAARRRGRR